MSFATQVNYANATFNEQMQSPQLEETLATMDSDDNSIIVENRFGTFAVKPESVIRFEAGLVGFSALREFALLLIPGTESGNKFRLLQSLEDANLSFIVMPTTLANTLLTADDVAALGKEHGIENDYLLMIFIATLREQMGKVQMTLNVRAPIIMDTSKGTASQVVLTNNDYPMQMPVKG